MEIDLEDAKIFQDSVVHQKSRMVRPGSNYTDRFWRRTVACTKREWWLLRGEVDAVKTKTMIKVGVSFVLGGLFSNMPDTTLGMFSLGGILSISLLFNSRLQLVYFPS